MTFREGMSKAELTAELISTMDSFRPAIAEMARDARRWQFCVEQDAFPERNREWTGQEDWLIVLNEGEFIFGNSPAECVDRAITTRGG